MRGLSSRIPRVPQAFVHLHPKLESAVDRSLVLTTTERLRRNLIRAYNDGKLAAGQTAWPTPRVQTVGSYLGILYRQLRHSDSDMPVLISAEAEYALFRATAPAGAAELVPLAQEAWSLCHQWGISITSANFASTENGLTFFDWSERLKRRLASKNAITRAELPSVANLRSAESRITCLAFEQVPVMLSGWLENQETELVYMDPARPAGRTPNARRMSFESAEDELAAVSNWSRRLLEQQPDDVRIGVIVPDLSSRYDTVLRQFTAELDPMLATGTLGLLDIGGGTPLRTQPVWQAARDWLALCFDRLAADQARRCLNSPYLSLPRIPSFPAQFAPTLSLVELDRLLDLQGLDTALLAWIRTLHGAEQTLAGWIDDFREAAKRAGWTGQHMGSNQFQAWQEIDNRLDGLKHWSDDRVHNGRAALQQIDQFLGSITFAPERPPASVQIMGYLESTGLDFTHLWVLGLSDESWPRLPTTNPFVPIRLLKQHRVPRTTPEQEAEFARDRLEQWRLSTDQMIVSHVRHQEESECRPSALIQHLPPIERLQELRPHPGFEHRHEQLEALSDLAGQPLEAGSHRGGTGRIRDQAACPFRGYAVHRLGLKEVRQPHGLPDALDRGTLIHEALHRLYENAATDGLAPAGLTDRHFGQAADQAIARHYGRFPAPFRERERERLSVLLGVWNRLESQRSDVDIVDLELGLTAEFGGIGLNLRIDRIDRIGDAHLVIDYKTGRIGNRLTQDRLLDPQLPLYALTNESVQGVLYAEIDDTRPRLKGVSALEVESASLEPPADGSWEAQRARWQDQIDTLTEEIRTGFAAVTPYDDRACQTCHLHGLCRVAALDHEIDPDIGDQLEPSSAT